MLDAKRKTKPKKNRRKKLRACRPLAKVCGKQAQQLSKSCSSERVHRERRKRKREKHEKEREGKRQRGQRKRKKENEGETSKTKREIWPNARGRRRKLKRNGRQEDMLVCGVKRVCMRWQRREKEKKRNFGALEKKKKSLL